MFVHAWIKLLLLTKIGSTEKKYRAEKQYTSVFGVQELCRLLKNLLLFKFPFL